MSAFFPRRLPATNSPDAALASHDDEGRGVTAGCHDIMKALDANAFDLGLCLGVLKGLHYLSQDLCIPSTVSLGDIASVVTRYFDAHPQQIDSDRELSLEAMRSAWPCIQHNI